jgi:probable HAF family extracellular repeat protein
LAGYHSLEDHAMNPRSHFSMRSAAPLVGVLLLAACTPDESVAPPPAVTQVPRRGPTASLITPTPIDLGTLGASAQRSAATGINDALQVVGWSETPSGVTHAFLWQGGAMQDLGTPNGQNSYATAINDAGRIVGYTDDAAGTQRPWVWTNGQYTYLPLPVGKSGRATAIAPGLGGFIAGCMYTPGQPTSDIITWNPSANPPYKRTSLGSPTNGPFAPCATGIDRYQRVSTTDGNVGGAVWRSGAFRFVGVAGPHAIYGMDPSGSGHMTGESTGAEVASYWPNLDLGPEVEFVPFSCENAAGFVKGMAVNSLGEIVGSGDQCHHGRPSPPPVGYAFFWATEAESELLPPLTADPTGCCATAAALNTTGYAVGASTVASGASHATIWGLLPEVTVLPLPPCNPRPCRVPPKVSYIPKKFLNDGILTRPGFDATLLDPNLITLGNGFGHTTAIARTARGKPMASIVDVDGDGLLDLKVSFSKAQLIADGVLTPTTFNLEVSAIEPTGLPWKGHYPIWVQ